MKEVIRISALLARHHQHRLARLTALALNRNTVVLNLPRQNGRQEAIL